MRMLLPISLAIAVVATSGCERPDKKDDVVGTSGRGSVVTGCVTSDAQGRFVLTADRNDVASIGTVATSGTVPTYLYQLVGGSGLQEYVGKRVEIRGQVSDREVDVDVKDKTTAE